MHDCNSLFATCFALLADQNHDLWQEKALSHALELFESGDVNGDGWLTCEEIVQTMLKGRERFPQLEVLPALSLSADLSSAVAGQNLIMEACAPDARMVMISLVKHVVFKITSRWY